MQFRTASSIYGFELIAFSVIYIFFGEFIKSLNKNYYEENGKIDQ